MKVWSRSFLSLNPEGSTHRGTSRTFRQHRLQHHPVLHFHVSVDSARDIWSAGSLIPSGRPQSAGDAHATVARVPDIGPRGLGVAFKRGGNEHAPVEAGLAVQSPG